MSFYQGLGCVRTPGTLFEESRPSDETHSLETTPAPVESDPFLELECLERWLDLNA
jgi:hypothetical protein